MNIPCTTDTSSSVLPTPFTIPKTFISPTNLTLFTMPEMVLYVYIPTLFPVPKVLQRLAFTIIFNTICCPQHPKDIYCPQHFLSCSPKTIYQSYKHHLLSPPPFTSFSTQHHLLSPTLLTNIDYAEHCLIYLTQLTRPYQSYKHHLLSRAPFTCTTNSTSSTVPKPIYRPRHHLSYLTTFAIPSAI